MMVKYYDPTVYLFAFRLRLFAISGLVKGHRFFANIASVWLNFEKSRRRPLLAWAFTDKLHNVDMMSQIFSNEDMTKEKKSYVNLFDDFNWP